MPWSGGSYTKGNNATGGWTGDASLGIGIEAGRHDTQDNDFATGINNCLTKDGQNTAITNLPMGGFKHTNVANGAARNEYLAIGQLQDGYSIWGGTSGGSANAHTITLSPAIPAYVAGQTFRFVAGFSNTGNTTININGLGVKSILSSETGAQLRAGALVANLAYEIVYDGTQFQLINPTPTWQAFTPTLTQGVTVTTTVNYSKYCVHGNLCTFQCMLTATSPGTALNAIVLSKPLVSIGSASYKIIGTAMYTDVSPFTTYVCAANDPLATTIQLMNDASGANSLGINPAITIASGDIISLSVSYEI